MNRNDPLKVTIEDGVLTMRIGVDVIAHAAKLSPRLAHYDHKAGETFEPKITDADKFAAEVMTALKDEDDEGSTLIHIALDQAMVNAVDMGAEGIELPGDH